MDGHRVLPPRCLVSFDPERKHEAVAVLRRALGLRIAFAADFGAAGSSTALRPGDAVLLESIGIAIVAAPSDAWGVLQRRLRRASLAWVAERRVQAATHRAATPDVRVSPAPPVQPPFTDDDVATWGVHAVGANRSRYAGRGVRVAVLDTGIDDVHPDFAGRVASRQSFVGDGSTLDRNGHGTFSAGILAGPSRPDAGPRYGIACEAALYVAKVLEDDASGADGNVLAALDWAVRSGCAVASLSLGMPLCGARPPSPLFEHAAARALAAGTLLLSSAGNNSRRPDELWPVDHPANCESIVAVGAVGPQLDVAPFSAAGLLPPGGVIGVVAPGVSVYSASIGEFATELGGGTSTSVSFAAGVAALLAEANPGVRGPALAALLQSSARRLPFAARDVGAGLAVAPP
jgi:subtilisin family serine protease